MAEVHYQEFYLDIDKAASKNLNQIVTGRLGDNMLTGLIVNVLENDKPFDLTDYSIRFEGTTSASTVVVDADNVEIESLKDGKFKYTFSNQVFSVLDQYQLAYFAFEKNSTRATTENFVINVIQDVDITWEEAESYISILNALIRKFNTEFEDSQRVKAQTFEEFLKNKETQYQTLSDTAKKLGIDLAAIQTSVTQLEKDTSALDTKVQALDKQVGNLKTTSEEVDTAFKSTKQKVDNLDITVKGLEEKTGTLKTDTTNLEDRVSTLKTDTSSLEEKTGQLQQAQTSLDTKLNETQQAIENNQLVDKEDLESHVNNKENPHEVTAHQVGALTEEETYANVIYQLVGKEKVRMTVSLDMVGKVAGSKVENPNWAGAGVSNIIVVPDGPYSELSQTYYDMIMSLDGSIRKTATSTATSRALHIAKYDVLDGIKRVLGEQFFIDRGADDKKKQKNVLSSIITQMDGAQWAFGSGPNGYNLSLSRANYADGEFASWIAPVTHQNGNISRIRNTLTTSGQIESAIDKNGLFCQVLYSDPSDGATASAVSIDYGKLDVTIELSAREHIEYVIAQYNVSLVALLNDAIERIEILEQGGNA